MRKTSHSAIAPTQLNAPLLKNHAPEPGMNKIPVQMLK